MGILRWDITRLRHIIPRWSKKRIRKKRTGNEKNIRTVRKTRIGKRKKWTKIRRWIKSKRTKNWRKNRRLRRIIAVVATITIRIRKKRRKFNRRTRICSSWMWEYRRRTT